MRGHFRVVVGGLAGVVGAEGTLGGDAVAGEPARCRQRRFGLTERAGIAEDFTLGGGRMVMFLGGAVEVVCG